MKFNLLVLISLFVSPMVWADHEHFSFAMPFSGQKANQYDIELTFRDNVIKKFHIPKDCSQIISDVNYGMSNPINILDRKLWLKAINDCKYVMLMHQYEAAVPEHDFVSNYDFYNARLADLPFAQKCDAEDNAEYSEQCKKIHESESKLLITSYFPFFEVVKDDGITVTEECKFNNGVFRGRLVRTSEGIRCQPDRRANGIRLLSVDVGDLNNDGYLDALLRIMPLGRGVSRFPILLPLTRFDENTSFTVCEGISPEYLSDF